MTEKRYYLEDFKDFTVITLRLYDDRNKFNHYDWLTDCNKIVNLLNELAEENEQLKRELTSLRVELDTHKHPLWSTREAERIVNELKEENEQLKHDATILIQANQDYRKENEQLKSKLFDCELELEHNKESVDDAYCELIQVKKENERLNEQNQKLQFNIIDMLDFVKEKGTVTREEMKEWWNNEKRKEML